MGIRRVRTWKEKVVLRADRPGGDVMLLLRDGDEGSLMGCTKLQVGEKYG